MWQNLIPTFCNTTVKSNQLGKSLEEIFKSLSCRVHRNVIVQIEILLLRAHDLPGGGIIMDIITSIFNKMDTK